jgi:hypothetical protein
MGLHNKLDPESEQTILLYRKMVDERYRKLMINNYSSNSKLNELIHGIKKID